MSTQPFWDRIAPKYAQKPIKNPAAYEETLSQVSSRLRAHDRILEIGCGTGSTALRLAPMVAHVTATDGSRGMIEIARAKLGPDTPTNISFDQADAADLVEGTPFDAICAFSLLHLVTDLPTVLDRVRQQLRPGGIFISKTVCLKDKNPLMRLLVSVLMAIGIAPKVTFLSRGELESLLGDTGFEIVHVDYFDAGRMNPFIVARKTADEPSSS